MKKKVLALLMVSVLTLGLMAGCGSNAASSEAPAASEATSEDETQEESAVEESSEESAEDVSEAEEAEETAEEAEALTKTEGCDLEDGEYVAEFNTDSGMFHVNEACEGKGVVTVKDGLATIHVSLVSKNIVNLYVGLAEDAQKDGAAILEPTVDEVTYSDGLTDEVYGFDIPLPVLEEEFDLALIGKKGTWYDHKVSVTNVTAE